MGAAKRDVSGVFDAELKTKRPRKATVLDNQFELGPKGITFATDTFLPEWTEVGVEVHMPKGSVRRDHCIGCRGVVVRCAPRQHRKGFEVSLLFLDLPKRAQAQLSLPPSARNSASISISR
jgi:hypothetical protein